MDHKIFIIILLIPSCLLVMIVIYEFVKGRKKGKSNLMDKDYFPPAYRGKEEQNNELSPAREVTTPKSPTDPKKTMLGYGLPQEDGVTSKLTSLAGFLVSFSNSETGEYWELREGNNTIGSARTNDIILAEKHVSGNHATINVAEDPKNQRWKFQMVDKSSSNGSFVNDERLDIYLGATIKDKDRIKIGGYELILFITDRFQQNLNRNPSFISSKSDLDYSENEWQVTKNTSIV